MTPKLDRILNSEHLISGSLALDEGSSETIERTSGKVLNLITKEDRNKYTELKKISVDLLTGKQQIKLTYLEQLIKGNLTEEEAMEYSELAHSSQFSTEQNIRLVELRVLTDGLLSRKEAKTYASIITKRNNRTQEEQNILDELRKKAYPPRKI